LWISLEHALPGVGIIGLLDRYGQTEVVHKFKDVSHQLQCRTPRHCVRALAKLFLGGPDLDGLVDAWRPCVPQDKYRRIPLGHMREQTRHVACDGTLMDMAVTHVRQGRSPSAPQQRSSDVEVVHVIRTTYADHAYR
jgi:hypothetical protein